MGKFTSARPPLFRLELPCDLTQVRDGVRAVHHFLTEQGCGESDWSACELALVEACNNAIRYVADKHRRRPVVIEAICEATELELRITDHTPGFDWPPEPTLPDEESEHGRGLFLIRRLMDYANYFRSPDGNILVLQKKRSRSSK